MVVCTVGQTPAAAMVALVVAVVVIVVVIEAVVGPRQWADSNMG